MVAPRAGRVLVLGSANMDVTVRVDRLPAPGETVLGGSASLHPGGKGANQAVAAAIAGADVTMAGSVGNDGYGSAVRAALLRAGADVSRLRSADRAATGLGVVLVDQAGENAIVVSPGANHAIDPSQVPWMLGDLQSHDLLLMQMELPVEVVTRAIDLAHAAGVPVMLNLAPAVEIPAESMRRLAVLVVNRSEAGYLLGSHLHSEEDLRRAASALRRRGSAAVVVTAGAEGSVIDGGHGPERVPAIPVDVVSTAGAGDAFVGYLAAWYAAGEGLRQAVDAATAAAAEAVRMPGAQLSSRSTSSGGTR